MNTMPGYVRFLRWFFFVLMATTGVAKLLDMPGFIGIVATYRSLPDFLIPPSAWALALSETGLAVWLAWGRHLRVAGVFIVLMHLMYLAWLVVSLLRGLQLDNCGCFGVYLARPLTWFSPLEDLSLLVMAVLFWRGAQSAERL